MSLIKYNLSLVSSLETSLHSLYNGQHILLFAAQVWLITLSLVVPFALPVCEMWRTLSPCMYILGAHANLFSNLWYVLFGSNMPSFDMFCLAVTCLPVAKLDTRKKFMFSDQWLWYFLLSSFIIIHHMPLEYFIWIRFSPIRNASDFESRQEHPLAGGWTFTVTSLVPFFDVWSEQATRGFHGNGWRSFSVLTGINAKSEILKRKRKVEGRGRGKERKGKR